MDDHNFDEHLKDKLEHYEDPAFDPAALASFRQRMSELRPVPWYRQYAPHLVAATLLLLTLSNGYMLWSLSRGPQNNTIASESTSTELTSHAAVQNNFRNQAVIDSLANVIAQMQCDQQNALAQAGVLHEHDKALLQQQYALAALSQSLLAAQAHKAEAVDSASYIGLVSDMPLAIYKALQEKGLIITKNGQAYLSSTVRKEYYPHRDSATATYDQLLVDRTRWSEVATPRYVVISPKIADNKNTLAKKEHQQKFSVKAKNELEEHYFSGLGINIAPHVDLMQNVFSPGDGRITPRAGFIADWVLSPRWSVETGVDYSFVAVRFNKKESDVLYPNTVAQLGYLSSSSLSCKLLSTPINLKYRRWISEDNQLILRTGFTPYFSFNNEYRFNYWLKPNESTNSGSEYNYNYLNVTAVSDVDKSYYYGGTWSVSAGVSQLLHTKEPVKHPRTFEASVFYEKNFNGGVGKEKYSLGLIGIKTALWFKMR